MVILDKKWKLFKSLENYYIVLVVLDIFLEDIVLISDQQYYFQLNVYVY